MQYEDSPNIKAIEILSAAFELVFHAEGKRLFRRRLRRDDKSEPVSDSLFAVAAGMKAHPCASCLIGPP